MIKVYYDVFSDDMIQLTIPELNIGYMCKSRRDIGSAASDFCNGKPFELIQVNDDNRKIAQGDGNIEFC